MAGLGVKHPGQRWWMGSGMEIAEPLQQETPHQLSLVSQTYLLFFKERCCYLQHPRCPSWKQKPGSAAPWTKQMRAPIDRTQGHHCHQTMVCVYRDFMEDRNVLALWGSSGYKATLWVDTGTTFVFLSGSVQWISRSSELSAHRKAMNLHSVPGAWTYCLPLKGGQSHLFFISFLFWMPWTMGSRHNVESAYIQK